MSPSPEPDTPFPTPVQQGVLRQIPEPVPAVLTSTRPEIQLSGVALVMPDNYTSRALKDIRRPLLSAPDNSAGLRMLDDVGYAATVEDSHNPT